MYNRSDFYKLHEQADNSMLAEYVQLLRTKYPLNNKVVLIQAPQFLFESFNINVLKNRGFYAYPPTGLQCIKKALSALSNRNLDIDILDLNFLLLKRVIKDEAFNCLDWLEILDDYLKENDPSIVGVTCISVSTDVTQSGFHLTRLLQRLRNMDKHIILAGGPLVTNEYEYYLHRGLCHFVITGEGENKVRFLFDYLFDQDPIHEPIQGIFFKSHGTVVETSGKRDTVVLKGNLIDTYKDVPIQDYNNVGSLNPFSRMAGQDESFSCIQLNRGCRANCKFCGVTEFMGEGLRQYPVRDVLDEIRYLVTERGVRHFEILDDDFLGTFRFKGALLELLSEMVNLRKEYGMTWAAGNGLIASSLNEELLVLMRDSGCVGFRIGIESGNELMLKKMRKPTSLALIKKVSTMLHGFGEIFVGGNYIIGLFGEETFGQMLDTYRFSCEIDLDWAAFTTFQVTSRSTAVAEKLITDARAAAEFVPTRDTPRREIAEAEEVISGPDVFDILEDTVPSREQIKHIWFTFNLVANYINNKNLRPGGKPEKLRSWLEAVQLSYPDNPYMPLFTALSHVLLGDEESARRYFERTKRNLQSSENWKHQFERFGLMELVNHFPQKAEEVFQVLEPLQSRYAEKVGGETVCLGKGLAC
ncbi:B12-binding domain-containing radical SAM protein [Acidobacteria bacterium AH-259-D05]|nr:B12-binding domain-containing radical SAM protein [Acidobacteria bacterium AH-259-D05]